MLYKCSCKPRLSKNLGLKLSHLALGLVPGFNIFFTSNFVLVAIDLNELSPTAMVEHMDAKFQADCLKA